eukprot:scaffold30696_cov21-Prasinocladus_malaysianus.AAC.1
MASPRGHTQQATPQCVGGNRSTVALVSRPLEILTRKVVASSLVRPHQNHWLFPAGTRTSPAGTRTSISFVFSDTSTRFKIY